MRDISATIAAGGTAQTLFDPQGQTYRGYWVRNHSATTSIWINENGTAAASQPSVELKGGEMFETPPDVDGLRETISVFCATTSVNFSGRVW